MQSPGTKPTRVELHPVNTLHRDPRVQRDLIPSRVQHFIDNLDLDGIGIITVSRRSDQTLIVLDGQHRLEALLAHDMGEWEVTCHVYTDLTLAEEAAKFLVLNNSRRPNSTTRYFKGLLAQDPECLAIEAIITRHGLSVAGQTGDGIISCVAAMERVYRGKGIIPGSEALDRALAVLLASWGVQAASVEGHLVQGVGMLMLRYGQAVDAAALISKLGKSKGGAPALVGQARGLRDIRKGSVADNVTEVVVSLYDHGRRTHRLSAVDAP